MKKGFWITVVLSGLVALFAFFLFVIWRPILISQEAEKGNNTVVKIDQKAVGKEEIKPPESGITVSDFIQDAEMSKEPGFKPFFEEEEQKIKETFLERFSSLTKLLEISSLVPVTAPPAPEEEPKALTTPKKTLTDEEWFKIAYPDDYINSLKKLEKDLRGYGFLAESEKFSFSLEKEILVFYHKLVDIGLKDGSLSQEEAERLRRGIDVVLPNLHQEEKLLYEKSLSVFLFTKIAHAQEVYIPNCYRMGLSTTPGGFNVWAQCCNCGYICGHHGCVFMPDPVGCGENGAACTIQLGCLNLTCPGWPAIWDPMTGLCGCG